MYFDPRTKFERVLCGVCTIEETRKRSVIKVLCKKYMFYRCANFKIDPSG